MSEEYHHRNALQALLKRCLHFNVHIFIENHRMKDGASPSTKNSSNWNRVQALFSLGDVLKARAKHTPTLCLLQSEPQICHNTVLQRHYPFVIAVQEQLCVPADIWVARFDKRKLCFSRTHLHSPKVWLRRFVTALLSSPPRHNPILPLVQKSTSLDCSATVSLSHSVSLLYPSPL